MKDLEIKRQRLEVFVKHYHFIMTAVVFCVVASAPYGRGQLVKPVQNIYYVDPNGSDSDSGGSGDPWRTVSYAEQVAEKGSIVYLRSGNFGEVVIDRLDSGRSSWAEAVTFRAEAGHSPVLKKLEIGRSEVSSPMVDRYIIFEDIKIHCPLGVDGTPDLVVIFQGGFVKLLNCEISGTAGEVDGEYFKGGATGSGVRAGTYYHAGVSDIIVENCHIHDSTRGVIIEGDSFGGMEVVGCVIHDVGGSGVRLSRGDNNGVVTYIDDNYLYNQLSMWNVSLTEYIHGSGLSIRRSDVTVRRNIIRSYAASTAITTYPGIFPDYGYQNMRFENNLVYDSRSPYYCVRFYDVGSNFVFNNNTITGTHTPGREDVHYYESGLRLDGYAADVNFSTIQVCNNIIVGYSDWGLAAAVAQGASATGNLFYSYDGDGGIWRDQSWLNANLPGNRVFSWGGYTADDFGLVRGVSKIFKGGYLFDFWAYYRVPVRREQGDNHNIDLGDSFYPGPGSVAIDYGDAAYSPATDIYGNSRGGSPDAGAYEFKGLYVSVDSVNDPGTGRADDPFRRIQDAVDAASRGGMIFVSMGSYNEAVTISKDVSVRGGYTNAYWWVLPDASFNETIIDANSLHDSAVRFVGADGSLEGFVIRGGSAENGGGIYCEGSDPVIRNCVVMNNYADSNGGGIFGVDSEPTIINCIITDNVSGIAGGGDVWV